MNDFAGRRVAVTGASGFIGGRVVERLVLETGAEVRALVRGYGRAARLSVLPQERLTFRAVDLDARRACRACARPCTVATWSCTARSGRRARSTTDGAPPSRGPRTCSPRPNSRAWSGWCTSAP